MQNVPTGLAGRGDHLVARERGGERSFRSMLLLQGRDDP
jgi:hypothetical protein